MRIAVAIPRYKVAKHVLGVIDAIGSKVYAIYAVDDACPESSGRFIEEHSRDPRVRVLSTTPKTRASAARLSPLTRRRLPTAWISWSRWMATAR